MPSLPGLTLLLGALVLVANPAAADPGGRLRLSVDQDRITLHADAVPLAEIVEALGSAAGFRTSLLGDFATPVSLALERVALADALERLLGDLDRIAIYQDTPPPRRLAHLWLFAGASAPGQPPRRDTAAPAPLPADGKRRSETVLRLSQSGDVEQALRLLERVLRDDDDALVRTRAVLALGALRDPRALPALTDALADDSASVRTQAIQALGQLGDPAAAETLGNLLLHDPDPQRRTLAAQALHHDGSPQAQGYLDAAADDPDHQVRAAVAGPPRPAASRQTTGGPLDPQ